MAWLNHITASLRLYAVLGACLARAEDGQNLVDRLTQAGVTPSPLYDGDAAANVSGGVKRGAAYSGTLHVRLALDGDRLAGLPGDGRDGWTLCGSTVASPARSPAMHKASATSPLRRLCGFMRRGSSTTFRTI